MIEERTIAQEEQHRRFLNYLSEVKIALAPYNEFVDIKKIDTLRINFQKKITDFFDSERKFNIAVIGQVKSGKSSFLNMLLFGGRQVLPQAATPKTCVLTRVEYAKEQQLLIEFYDVFEWAQLKKTARLQIESTEVHAARDLVAMAMRSDADMTSCFDENIRKIPIDDPTHLNDLLEDYVGERGKYTALVKSVTLYMDIPEIENISIVDTPGLNDPVPSRRLITQEFLERCDAAFFLSCAGYFMDANDTALISSQLPQKGTKKLILIASQYDNVLMDALCDGDDFAKTNERLKTLLAERAKKSVSVMTKQLTAFDCSKQVIDVVAQCQKPYFISVVAERMAQKPKEGYDELETLVYNNLSRHTELSPERLEEISGFSEIRSLYGEMSAQKQVLLAGKAASFAVVSNSELKQILYVTHGEITAEINRIKTEILPQHEKKSKELKQAQNRIRTAIDEAFEDCYKDVEQSSYESFASLVKNRKKIRTSVKTEVEVVNIDIDVDDSVWWNPLSWRKKHKEYITQQKKNRYADTNDVLAELTFAENGIKELYGELRTELLSFDVLKQKLFGALLPLTEHDTEALDAMLEASLQKISMPQLQLDFHDIKKQLQERYYGKINDEIKAREMIAYSDELLKNMMDILNIKLQKNVRIFTASLTRAREHLTNLVSSELLRRQVEIGEEHEQEKQSLAIRTEAVEVLKKII